LIANMLGCHFMLFQSFKVGDGVSPLKYISSSTKFFTFIYKRSLQRLQRLTVTKSSKEIKNKKNLTGQYSLCWYIWINVDVTLFSFLYTVLNYTCSFLPFCLKLFVDWITGEDNELYLQPSAVEYAFNLFTL